MTRKTARDIAAQITGATYEKTTGTNQWGKRHAAAWGHATSLGIVSPLCGAISGMVKAWIAYADAHHERYNSSIGQDHVLGVEWESIGHSLLGLLNGDLGELDGGTLDGMIRAIAKNEGLDLDS